MPQPAPPRSPASAKSCTPCTWGHRAAATAAWVLYCAQVDNTRPYTPVSGVCLIAHWKPLLTGHSSQSEIKAASAGFFVPLEYPVAIDRSLRHETASLRSRPSARHRICSAGDQCLRVVVRTESVVRTRTARRGLCRARRWVLVGQIVVSLPLASGLESRLARRSAA